MTATLSLRPHANLHVLDGAVRPVHVIGPDTETPAFGLPGPRTWVAYAGGPGDVAVTYSVPDGELRSGAFTDPVDIRLGAAQLDVAHFRFEDVRDGSPNDEVLGAELHHVGDGTTRLRVHNLADALDTLDNALDIVSEWTGERARREQRATRSLRDKVARLVSA